MSDFYDQLTPFYHLIYGDWEAAIETQAAQLSTIISKYWDQPIQTVLDASCGIGTQTIGLADKGFRVTASDLSAEEIKRAKEEAKRRHLDIHFSVCDMREAYRHHQAQFDLVISCDNSIPHLLNDEEILKALSQLYACTCSGGGCLLTLRDYDKEPRGSNIVKPYGVREEADKRYFVFQIWDFEGDVYDLSFYFIEEERQSNSVKTHVMRSRYYAISPRHLAQLMEEAGYVAVVRLDDEFFQPVLVGRKAS
jgi:SAM-dependent methyltransferase